MLRTTLICAFVTAFTGTAFAVNPPAENAIGLVLHSTLSSVTGENSGIAAPVADVKPGETFTITGECVTTVRSADSLRVVLTLADSDAVKPGYRSVLATDQEIRAGGLYVRVPDMPEAANRIFMVKVFRLGQEVPQICDAGTIRIGDVTPRKLG
jgi:hypothetical protein